MKLATTTAKKTVYERKAPKLKHETKPLPTFKAPAVIIAGVPYDEALKFTEGCCMWPLWGLDANKGPVCGKARYRLDEGTSRERNSSYCLGHHQRAYPAFSKQRK